MSSSSKLADRTQSLPDPAETDFAELAELAFDLRNCWDHSTDPVWSKIEPELWSLTHNPWLVLQAASRAKLALLERDSEFRQRVAELVTQQRQYLNNPGWFQNLYHESALTGVAYFSMEFGLSEALPIYAGGLGNVAGDYLKAASDLGLPIVGVGLLYQQGYFRQVVEADGTQRALYPFNDPGQMPVTPARDNEGEWVRLRVQLPGHELWLRTWQAQVGRVKLYLLDSNDPANLPAYRGITSELYASDPALRLAQELVLGIGGWRMLRALGINPQVCHLNEGHCAFAVLERAASHMEDTGQAFDLAFAITRIGNLFTTHTPVAAGFDSFDPSLIARFVGRYVENRLGISLARLLAMGRINPSDVSEPFNMAYLAARGSGAINGVSRLHGAVSRRIFQCLFPRWPEAEVPIGHVTNGVHTPTWDSAAADAIWTDTCGRERWRGTMESVRDSIGRISADALWEMRTRNRFDLVRFVRERLQTQLAGRGEDWSAAQSVFQANALTLCFARRFASYKRPNLLLHDPERLTRILTNPGRPVQLVIAGKAHPEDKTGQAMLRDWVSFIQRPEIRQHAVFLNDYDLEMAERLVQGADVWINTPRRPWEACGTSGMKVLVNGGLNLSELDGWWAEAYSPEVGWALGDGQDHGDDPAWDAIEAEKLYKILEEEVVSAFYDRDENGIPAKWIAMARESMARLAPRFSANRALREYTESYYLPAAQAYLARTREHERFEVSWSQWRQQIREHWGDLCFGELRTQRQGDNDVFDVQVFFGRLSTSAVKVELYADSSEGEPPFRSEMTQTVPIAESLNGYVYSASVTPGHPTSNYTPRIIPFHPAARIPLEDSHILWFR